MKRLLFDPNAAEEYLGNQYLYYRNELNQIFREENEGRDSANPIYSARYQKYLGISLGYKEVLEYFKKFDLEQPETEAETENCLRNCKCISIKEVMPTIHRSVLIFSKTNGWAEGEYIGNGKWRQYRFNVDLDDVTHWISINRLFVPMEPKEDEA